MRSTTRVTFDPPSDTVQAYRLTELLKRAESELPPPEVVRSADTEVLLYCWDRKRPREPKQ